MVSAFVGGVGCRRWCPSSSGGVYRLWCRIPDDGDVRWRPYRLGRRPYLSLRTDATTPPRGHREPARGACPMLTRPRPPLTAPLGEPVGRWRTCNRSHNRPLRPTNPPDCTRGRLLDDRWSPASRLARASSLVLAGGVRVPDAVRDATYRDRRTGGSSRTVGAGAPGATTPPRPPAATFEPPLDAGKSGPDGRRRRSRYRNPAVAKGLVNCMSLYECVPSRSRPGRTRERVRPDRSPHPRRTVPGNFTPRMNVQSLRRSPAVPGPASEPRAEACPHRNRRREDQPQRWLGRMT